MSYKTTTYPVNHRPGPIRNPDGSGPEDKFRQQVRDILGFHWDARDEQIYAKLRQLAEDQMSNGRWISQTSGGRWGPL